MAPLSIVDQKLKNWNKSQNAKGGDIPKELPFTQAIGVWIIGNSVPKNYLSPCPLGMSVFSVRI